MAKRAAPNEKPYRPLLDADLVTEAISHAGPSPLERQASSAQILEMPPANGVRRTGAVMAAEGGPNGILPREKGRDAINPLPTAQVAKFDQEKRILLTREDSQAIDRMVVSLAIRLKAQVKVSHVMRALIALLLNAEGEIDRRAGEAGRLVRPANGDAQALESFQHEISRIIIAGLRDAGPIST